MVLPAGTRAQPSVHGGDSGSLWLASRLGLSKDYLAVAGPLFSYSWQPRPAEVTTTIRSADAMPASQLIATLPLAEMPG